MAGPNAVEYINGLEKSADSVASSVFERELKKEQDKFDSILSMDGTENAYDQDEKRLRTCR